MEKDSVLEMRHIYKTFPGVKALQNVDFTLKKGEIHALMGENGAGKSTLIKVLTGVEEFETGEIMIDGCDHTIINRSPQEAQSRGISTVYQEVNLCPNLTVAENLFIGREPRKAGLIDWKTMNKRAAKLLQDLDIHADVTQTIDNYSIAIQQNKPEPEPAQRGEAAGATTSDVQSQAQTPAAAQPVEPQAEHHDDTQKNTRHSLEEESNWPYGQAERKPSKEAWWRTLGRGRKRDTESE